MSCHGAAPRFQTLQSQASPWPEASPTNIGRSGRQSTLWLAALVRAFDDVETSHKQVPVPDELRAQLLRPAGMCPGASSTRAALN